MARHLGLPSATARPISKQELLTELSAVDANEGAKRRALVMETEFRRRITLHVQSLPPSDARFAKFNTNPFVLMFHSLKKGYRHIREIESDILPAKVFSSMETSAGRMVEAVVLPVYGWQVVPSQMHSSNSILDGKSKKGNVLCLATLKSGPRCLNDEMSENMADAILLNFKGWAEEAGVKEIDFTYGVLYGTQRQSNKKDWHVLRNIEKKLKGGSLRVSPHGQWNCEFEKSGVKVRVTIRIGTDLWNYIGGKPTTFVELSTALIRACITPGDIDAEDYKFTIADLPAITSLETVPDSYNVALLQRSQLEWFFFFARHFCDEITQ